jgi:ankyrin repeat protein
MPTAILRAVYERQAEALAQLLATQPALTIFEAAAVGDAARVRQLLAAEPALTHSWADDGWTPLHLAAFFGRPEALEALLAHRADPRALSSNGEGNTPLHSALAGRGDPRIVTQLLAAGADVNALAAGDYTPLHIAAFRDDVATLEMLLARGANAQARTRDGRTALAIAEARGCAGVARRLRGEMP